MNSSGENDGKKRELSRKLDKIKKHYANNIRRKLDKLKSAEINLKTERPL